MGVKEPRSAIRCVRGSRSFRRRTHHRAPVDLVLAEAQMETFCIRVVFFMFFVVHTYFVLFSFRVCTCLYGVWFLTRFILFGNEPKKKEAMLNDVPRLPANTRVRGTRIHIHIHATAREGSPRNTIHSPSIHCAGGRKAARLMIFIAIEPQIGGTVPCAKGRKSVPQYRAPLCLTAIYVKRTDGIRSHE